MRKPLRRKMTATTPSAVVKGQASWMSRLLLGALALLLCAGVGYFAFEKGKEAAGMSSISEDALQELHEKVQHLETELDGAQTVINTADSKLTTEKAAQTKLKEEVDRLTAENSQLRNDLGFYENLIPSANANKVEIRGLQADVSAPDSVSDTSKKQLHWQVLLMHPQKSAKQTAGTLYLNYTYEKDGKQTKVEAHQVKVHFKQHKRFDGVLELPQDHTIIKKFSATLKRGNALLARESISMD